MLQKWTNWWLNYSHRTKRDKSGAETINQEERISRMNQVNPKYVLRNYMAQMAIDKADQNDYTLLYELYEMLKNPYKDQPEYERWYAKRPDWAKEKVGCSMLSCSS
ncbi:MAG: YdiU family protein [Saprospiraceae bacterium]|nr:YdiU family protein [Saprospiraceae bacterium]